MIEVRDILYNKIRHYVINFNKTRLQIEVGCGLDYGGFDQPTDVDIRGLVEEPGGVPVGTMCFIPHVNKDGIVSVSTSDGVLVLLDAFVNACSCFPDVLEVARGARDCIHAHLTFVRR